MHGGLQHLVEAADRPMRRPRVPGSLDGGRRLRPECVWPSSRRLLRSPHFGLRQWLAVTYLGAIGSAFVFFLWSFALARTTPTRVAISVTVNPVAAAIVGALLLAEPVSVDVLVGLAAIIAGIGLVVTDRKTGG